MLTMSQVNHIKDLSNCGYRICEISEKTGADPKKSTKTTVLDYSFPLDNTASFSLLGFILNVILFFVK